MNYPPVFILGMHRSGTSAIAGALHTLGYHFGSNLVDPQPGINDRGFFEDQAVLTLHEAIFKSWNRDWRTPLLPPEGWLEKASAEGFATGVEDLIRQFSTHSRWGVKDPRLCLLLPLWQKALEGSRVHAKAIIMLRHPAAVAASLNTRDQLPPGVGFTLWMQHILLAEQATRGLDRILVGYDQLIRQPLKTLEDITTRFALPVEDSLDAAAGFLSPELCHHNAGALAVEPAELLEIWRVLTEEGIDTATSQSALDFLHERLVASSTLLGPALEGQNRQIMSWEAEFTDIEGHLRSQTSVLADQQDGLAEATRQLEETRAAADTYRQVLEEQRSGYAQTVEMLHERDGQLLGLAEAFRQLELTREAAEAFQRVLEEQRSGYEQAVAMLQERDEQLLALQQKYTELEARLVRQGEAVEPEEDAPRQETRQPTGDSEYRAVIDLRVDNNSHTRVIRYIRDSGSPEKGPILDVGCSFGYFGEALRDLGYEVWGIELNPAAITEARERLDRVYAGSIETFLGDSAMAGRRFQFIVFGDVLEHLIDPASTLVDCRALLTDGGAVIASIPNVAHRSVRLMLLEGRWDYDETGILDRTHLHFFTRDLLVDLMDGAGFAIQRFSAVTLGSKLAGITVTPKVDDAFGKFIDDRERDVFQFVVMAAGESDADVRASTNRHFRLRSHHQILCLPPIEESSLFSIRLGDPLARMTEMYGGEFRVKEPHRVKVDDLVWADTIIFQRESNAGTLDMMQRFQEAGKRVIFDIDDLLVDVPEYLSVAKHCNEIKPWLEGALRQADAVSVSTAELRDVLLAYNPHVYVNPNYAWTSEKPVRHYASDDPVRIIVASSDSVRVDFLVSTLRAVVGNPALNVTLVGIGPPGEYLREQGLEIEVHPMMDHGRFKSFLAAHDNTMGLIPLDDNRFNRCKSAIKFFDYALAGIPAVCSAVVPYVNVIDDPDNGILCVDDEAGWTREITMLVNEPERRQKIADTARTRCLEMHNLDRTAAAWEEMLRDTAFPNGDPVYGYAPRYTRTPWQLARGTLRHVTRLSSYRALWRACREGGIRTVWDKWKTVF